MSKLKIAAVVSVLLASGVFGGVTYKAANKNSENLRTTIVTETAELYDEDYVTDEESTAAETDETATDDETTAEETIAEKSRKEKNLVIITTAPEETKKPETSKKTEAETTKAETNTKLDIIKQELAAPAEATTTTTTTAPTEKREPETVKEEPRAVEAPAETEKPAETVKETVRETEPVTTTTTPAPVKEEPETEPETEAPAETEPVIEEPEEEPEESNNGYAIQVSDEEYVWLCNVVGHEYGSDWVPIEEKALVVEAVMNRVNSPLYPDNIYDVLTQPYQFSGLEWTLSYGGFTYQVTDSVKAAVDLYLTHPEQFQHGYTSFWGDGSANHFY